MSIKTTDHDEINKLTINELKKGKKTEFHIHFTENTTKQKKNFRTWGFYNLIICFNRIRLTQSQ